MFVGVINIPDVEPGFANIANCSYKNIPVIVLLELVTIKVYHISAEIII